MKNYKQIVKTLAVILIALLCFFLPGIHAQTKKGKTMNKTNYFIFGNDTTYIDENIGVMPPDYKPQQKLEVANGNYQNKNTAGMQFTSTGEVGIESIIENQISISTKRYNDLTKDCRWQLLGAYSKNNCYTSLWKDKKTGEIKEIIGNQPPAARLCVICGKEFYSNYGTHKCTKRK